MSQNLSSSHCHTIDDKKRIRIPAPFRKILGDNLSMIAGKGGCIIIMPTEEGEKKLNNAYNGMDEIQPSKINDKLHREASLQKGMNYQITEDAQGRFVVPPILLKYSGITGDIISVGMGNRIEMWAEDRYFKYIEKVIEESSFDVEN